MKIKELLEKEHNARKTDPLWNPMLYTMHGFKQDSPTYSVWDASRNPPSWWKTCLVILIMVLWPFVCGLLLMG